MAAPLAVDEGLFEYGTETQVRYAKAVNEHGGVRPAARALNVDPASISVCLQTLRRNAASNGYAPGHFSSGVAPGYRMGKVTVHRVNGEMKQTWERQHPTAEDIRSEIEALAAHVMSDVRGLSPLREPAGFAAADLLASYWFGDPHFGLASSAEDGGEDTDLAETDRLTRAGIDAMVSRMPRTARALVCTIGDSTHANDGSALTPANRNPLDVDPRGFGAAFLSCARATAYAIARALERHDHVEAWILPGNHDPDAAFGIAVAVSMFFDNNPRVTVRLSRDHLWWLQFGKNLIAACHGDKLKPVDIHGVLSNDCQSVWGACDFRYVWRGHIHHDTVIEYQRTRIESLRTLARSDAWHRSKGYRSMRDTRAVLYHAEFGEAERHTISAAMLERALAA